MVWFRVDDVLPFHQRVIEAGNAAMGLWVRAGAWSSGQLTDGYIPRAIARQIGTPAEIKRLLQVGLWVEDGDGYRFHAWAEDGTGAKRQPTRADVEAQRKGERERKAAYRAKRDAARDEDRNDTLVPVGQVPGHPPDVRPESQWASGHPAPTRPDPTPLPKEGGARDLAHPPAPFCPKHPTGVDEPCRACGDARRRFDAWTPPVEALPAARSSAWRPGLCREHLQLEGKCEMCEYENRYAAEVIQGRFGGAV